MPAMPGMLGGLSYRLIEASIMRNDRFDRSTDMKPLPLIRKIWEANRVDDVKKNFDRRSSPRLLVELFFLSSHSTIILPPPLPSAFHLDPLIFHKGVEYLVSTGFPFESSPLHFIRLLLSLMDGCCSRDFTGYFNRTLSLFGQKNNFLLFLAVDGNGVFVDF